MPLGKLDLLLGYGLAFGLVAVVQALLASGLMLGLLDLDVAGPAWLLVVVAVVDAVLGCALGLFVSAFARTEFQAVQFMPAIVLPQFLLCGLLVPRDESGWLEAISAVLPLVRGRRDAADHGRARRVGPDRRGPRDRAGRDRAGARLGAATLRRRTA